jgi:Ca-activated chloride channel family protein
MFGRTVYRNIKVDVDEPTLKHIAEVARGQFYRATDGKSLEQIFQEIDKLEKSKVELSQYKQYRDWFPWFLASGFAVIALQAVLGETVWRRLP